MKFFKTIATLGTVAAAALISTSVFMGAKTIDQLLGENKKLQSSIANLNREEQIGFAKVIKQEEHDGQILTTLRFVETARDDKMKTVLEKEYEIVGDVVHFDSLIVTFSNQSVAEGQERSLYIWRRIYGEEMPPSQGFQIEEEGARPARYADLLSRLSLSEQDMFWEAIWQLANDPEALKKHGIKAIYGNVVYKKLQPGLIYVFKIGATGQVYPDTVPDM